MAEVSVENLSKSFGLRSHAVSNISFSVPDRGFLSLLGPSGCGKSTILRLIAGLEEPSNGEIKIGDLRVNDLPPSERDVAMVFQSYALYPHMSCYDNMAVSLRLHKLPEAEIKKRVRETAELLGVEDLLARKPKQLSGGQRQRIALGRAVVRRPKALLLDEPLSNLDAQLRERMRAELKRLFNEMKVTVLYVTHDQSEAMSMSDKIVVLKDGRLQQHGTPRTIYDAPANLFVAGFLGSPRINVVNGECRSDRFVCSSFDLPLNGAKAPNGKLLLGARPEHIELSRSPAQDAIEGRIELIEPLGLYTKAMVRVGEELIGALGNDDSLEQGQSVGLRFNNDKMLFFDAATEELIAGGRR